MTSSVERGPAWGLSQDSLQCKNSSKRKQAKNEKPSKSKTTERADAGAAAGAAAEGLGVTAGSRLRALCSLLSALSALSSTFSHSSSSSPDTLVWCCHQSFVYPLHITQRQLQKGKVLLKTSRFIHLYHRYFISPNTLYIYISHSSPK